MKTRTSLLLEEQLVGLAEQMTVELIMTGLSELVTVGDNDRIGLARQRMGSSFDQLPVTDGSGAIIGLVRRTDLAEAEDQALVRTFAAMAHGLKSLRTTDSIHESMNIFSATDCALVFDPRSGQFCGLLHLSDLNKQAVRVFLYLWISALEMGVAEYVRYFHPRLKEWMGYVPSGNRASFLGEFILRKRERMDLSPVEGLYLADLLVILRKLPLAPERLGMLKKELENLARPEPLGELRNMVMHPVRAIVHQASDVVVLRERLNTLRRLIVATSRAMANAS